MLARVMPFKLTDEQDAALRKARVVRNKRPQSRATGLSIRVSNPPTESGRYGNRGKKEMGTKIQRRRSYGIGRKFKRGSTWWVAIYDGAGNQIRKSTGSENESAANELLGRLLRERSRGELAAINSQSAYTLGDALDDYLTHRTKLADGTLATYR